MKMSRFLAPVEMLLEKTLIKTDDGYLINYDSVEHPEFPANPKQKRSYFSEAVLVKQVGPDISVTVISFMNMKGSITRRIVSMLFGPMFTMIAAD